MTKRKPRPPRPSSQLATFAQLLHMTKDAAMADAQTIADAHSECVIDCGRGRA